MLKQIPVTPLATLIMHTVECSSHSCERSARAQPPHKSTTVSPSMTTEQAAPSSSSSRKFSANASKTGANSSSQMPRKGYEPPRASTVSWKSKCGNSLSPIAVAILTSVTARGVGGAAKVALRGRRDCAMLPAMTHDVIVVGGGPTGLVTALGLAQAGVRVLLIEAGDAIIDSPRAA